MLQCSFCRKTEDEVSKLVAGPDVYICDECVRVAGRLMREPGLFTRLWRLLKRQFRRPANRAWTLLPNQVRNYRRHHLRRQVGCVFAERQGIQSISIGIWVWSGSSASDCE